MLRHTLPLVLLTAACAQGELQVALDDVPVQSGTFVDLGVTRRGVLVPDAATLTLSNVGRGTLTIDEVELPPGVGLLRNDLPLDLVDDRFTLMRLGLAATQEGPVEGTVVIRWGRGAREAFELEVQGEVEPYVQLHLEERPDVTTAVQSRVEADGLVGAAAAVVEGQDIVWMQGFGQADREAGVEVDPSLHRFRWASLSKGLTATAAAAAVDQGELGFDEEITALIADFPAPDRYLPAGCQREDCAQPLPEDAPPLTLRMLLSHTGGIQHYSNGVADPQPPLPLRNSSETNTGMYWALPYFWDHPLVAVPGEAYSYSTFGYNLAGVAIEEGVDQDLQDLVAERISEPLGITTLAPDRAWDPAPDRVSHYRLSDGQPVLDGDNDVSWKLAGGGFTSSVEDLARYCAGLLGDVVVDPATRDDELWAEQLPGSGYGLGFGVSGSGEGLVISHTGAQEGTRTALRIEPGQDRCYVFMSNSSWADPAAVVRAMRDASD